MKVRGMTHSDRTEFARMRSRMNASSVGTDREIAQGEEGHVKRQENDEKHEDGEQADSPVEKARTEEM